MQWGSSSHYQALAVAAAAACSMFSAAPAAAALVTPVLVSLIASGGYTQGGTTVPTPISASRNIDYANPITAISPVIGQYLLSGETVEMVGESIHIRAFAGDNLAPGPNNLRTGLLGFGPNDKARWVITGLDIPARNITGYTVSTLDTSGAGAGTFSGVVGGTLFLGMTDTDSDGSLDQLTVNLEDLRLVARPGVTSYNLNFADITVSFVSAPITEQTVPEPSSLLLGFAALAGLAVSGRARRGAARLAATASQRGS